MHPAAEVEAHGVRALPVGTEVTDDAQVADLASRTIAELGGAHVVCANAGVLLQGNVRDMNVQDWEWLYGVNVFGVVRTCVRRFGLDVAAQLPRAGRPV